ncbi:MAG: Isocitrate dehydrogenase [NADP] [Myxococcota bacterium]|nr:Isocitrate dehydrogenase [NADP] [Myxococcota bacterium]
MNVTIRKALDLYANVRPSRSLPGVSTRYPGVNLIIIRENIEDTYGGIEHMQTKDVAQCLRLITRQGCQKIVRFAFEMARQQHRTRLLCVHKANIMKMTDGLFLEVFRETAAQYPEITTGDMMVDNACMQLVTNPQGFDMMVMPNLFGDIVSDLAAGLVGGLGVAPGGNIGDNCAVFEAVHGSAPDIAGLNRANPTAILLSACAMLRHIGLPAHADRIEKALRDTMEGGTKTGDLGGKATTTEFTDAICAEVEKAPRRPTTGVFDSVAESCIVVPDFPRVPAQQRKLVGFDIFVEHVGIPPMPHEVGPFKLIMISNRGTKVWPGDDPGILLVDVHRCRYQTQADIKQEDVMAAIQEIGKSFAWMHVEKLQIFDGKEGFTKAQGQ